MLAAVLIFIGISLINGKGGLYVSGYNRSVKRPEAKPYERYFLRKAGYFILSLALPYACIAVFNVFDIKIGMYISIAVLATLIIGGLVFLNKDKKIKRAVYLALKLEENPAYTDKEMEADDFKLK